MFKRIIRMLLLPMMVVGMLSSCTAEENTIETNGSSKPSAMSRAAVCRIVSNDQYVGDASQWYYKVMEHENSENARFEVENYFWANHPEKGNGEFVTDDESNAIREYLTTKPEGSKDFGMYCYYIQPVKASYKSYTTTEDQNHHTQDVVGTNKMNQISIKAEGFGDATFQLPDYNQDGGKRTLIVNRKITDVLYHSSWGNNWISDYKFVMMEYNGKMNMYLCMDYHDVSQNGDVLADGVYDDYIIKIIPAEGEFDKPEVPSVPIIPIVTPQNKQVEVNLSIKANTKENPSSKLSIHVRMETDFEVFIPIPLEYVTTTNTMYISEQHIGEKYTNNEGNSLVVYRTIEGQVVKFFINYEQNGIVVKSEGINQIVIDYLNHIYKDGITFEVTNYFNENMTNPLLKQMLDQSIIRFTKEVKETEYLNKINEFCHKVDDEGHNVLDKDGNPVMVPNAIEGVSCLDCVVSKQ